MSRQINWTGERLETFIHNDTMVEHLHRYAFAMNYAKGGTVLDIACGEGYGSHLLSKIAKKVIGVDIDTSTIKRARLKYKQENLSFLTGSVTNIPIINDSIDIVISFETIEHLEQHDLMLKEISRVLKKNGLLIISTPDKNVYSSFINYKNPFHVKELSKTEFTDLLRKHFETVNILNQQPILGSIIYEENNIKFEKRYQVSYDAVRRSNLSGAVYLIALATNDDSKFSYVESSICHDRNLLHDEANLLRSSMEYRIGKFLTYPFKIVTKYVRIIFK
jgi:ubiquinone/menaquinone biosynthesis C-methylase UbiE